VIVHTRSSDYPAAARKARTALAEFAIDGIRTNLGFLRELLSDSQVQAGFQTGGVTTGFLDEKLPGLAAAAVSHEHEVRVTAVELYPGEEVLRAQLAGTVVELPAEGLEFGAGAQLVVLEAMKMQHVLVAPDPLRTVRSLVAVGQVVGTGDPLVVFARTGAGG